MVSQRILAAEVFDQRICYWLNFCAYLRFIYNLISANFCPNVLCPQTLTLLCCEPYQYLILCDSRSQLVSNKFTASAQRHFAWVLCVYLSHSFSTSVSLCLSTFLSLSRFIRQMFPIELACISGARSVWLYNAHHILCIIYVYIAVFYIDTVTAPTIQARRIHFLANILQHSCRTVPTQPHRTIRYAHLHSNQQQHNPHRTYFVSFAA